MIKSRSSAVRLKQIVSVLIKHKVQQGVDPIKLRLILEDLGPTYVKIGQIMSTRADIFSKRYTDELAKLREEVAPISFDLVEEQLHGFYGDYHTVFSEVDPEPLGSGSIAQVHKARLKNGTDVVIKIKRPGIYEQMERDVVLMKKAGKLLDILDAGNGVVDFEMVIDEFWSTTQDEMDFKTEADHAQRFKKQYESCQFIDAPKIYSSISNEDLLVMEYIDGYEINQSAALDEAGYDRHEIADKIAYNFITQIIENGYFHADPHSGNIRIREGQIVWIDFGMMSTLSRKDKELMKSGIRAIAGNDPVMLVDTILALGEVKKEVDYSALMLEMEGFMASYLVTDLKEIDIVAMVTQIFEICHNFGIMLPKGISMLARALMTIEGTLVALDKNLNIMELVSDHISDWTHTDTAKQIKDAVAKVYGAGNAMLNIPVQTSDLLKMTQRGQLKVNLNLLSAESAQAQVNRMVNRIVICVLDAALLMGSSIICTTNMKPQFLGIPLIGFFGFFFAMCLSLWLFFKMLFLHHKNKTF